MLIASGLFQSNELRHIFDTMDDLGDVVTFSENRRVNGTPITFLKPASFGLGAPDVVFLHRHRSAARLSKTRSKDAARLRTPVAAGSVVLNTAFPGSLFIADVA